MPSQRIGSHGQKRLRISSELEGTLHLWADREAGASALETVLNFREVWTRAMPQLEAYIHSVKPSHLARRTVFRILTETEPMTMANAMISALLVA